MLKTQGPVPIAIFDDKISQIDSNGPSLFPTITPTLLSPYETPPLPALDAETTISSPYTDSANHLDLTPLDLPNRLLATALSQLQPIRKDYATAPYLESFNWPEVFRLLRELCRQTQFEWTKQDFYLVIFRSQLKISADRERLGMLDQKSHEEACASGFLLKYWFGRPDAERRNLATCVWRNRADAAAGGAGPWHKKARGAAREMYDSIEFHTHRLVVGEDALTWELEKYVE